MTATALGALLRSAIDPALRPVGVLPDHGWSPPDLEPIERGGEGFAMTVLGYRNGRSDSTVERNGNIVSAA